MEHISFIILHYLSYNHTKNCVESILNNVAYPNYSIIIVDNNSQNNSVEQLQSTYQNNNKVFIICNSKNLGFANGNNVGYRYAKEKFDSKYMIVANNDTIFSQTDFIEKVISLYEKYHFYILGPDIVTLDNLHQNPYRDHVIELSAARKWLFNRYLWTLYLRIEKNFYLPIISSFVRNLFQKRDKKKNINKNHTTPQTNVVLQGACIIFSPLYVSQMDYAFFPHTYMYCEEDILSYQCVKKNWLTLYSPDLYVLHAECGATKELYTANIDKEIFQSENIVKSLRKLIKIMKE